MIPPLDPFALQFDSIEIDRTRAPSPAAIDRALAIAAPQDDGQTGAPAPGFYLLDDAQGRFVVDREMGVVSLKNDTLLAREHGAVHGVRLRVIEASGASYDLDIQLRLTGRVPQMVGAEDFGFADAAPAWEPEAAVPAPAPIAPPTPRTPWNRYAAGRDGAGAVSICEDETPYGGLVSADIPALSLSPACLNLDRAPPAPAGARAAWSI
jgi:hypothetical protein